MPYANNNGVKIYYEVEGKGPPLVLAHGISNTSGFWRRWGYVEALKNDFQLVLFDARGCGRSDKPHDPAAYGLNMVDDVVTILDHLGIDRTHYFGYSLGSTIGYQLAKRYPERLLAAFLPPVLRMTTKERLRSGRFLWMDLMSSLRILKLIFATESE